MQRGSAKTTPSEPSTPNGPPAKKRVRLSNGGSATPTEQEILRSALEKEEKKKEDAINRAAEQAGETKWVLSVRDVKEDEGLKVSYAGFGAIDQNEEDEESGEEEEEKNAIMSFGGGVKKNRKVVMQNVESDSEDEEEESEEGSEDDSDDPAAQLIRETKREVDAQAREEKRMKKRERQAREAAQETPKRAPKIDEDMDLRGMTSLSGGKPSGGRQGGLSGGGRDFSTMECFRCGEKGHPKSECPKGQSQGRSSFGGRGGGRGNARGQSRGGGGGGRGGDGFMRF